jgi:hypothetical protein
MLTMCARPQGRWPGHGAWRHRLQEVCRQEYHDGRRLFVHRAHASSSNFATMKEGICISRRADRNFESLGPVRAQPHAAPLFRRLLITLLQILCAALNGLRLPSFPAHSVAVK